MLFYKDHSLFIQEKTSGAHNRPTRSINLQFMRGEKVIKARCFRPAGLWDKMGLGNRMVIDTNIYAYFIKNTPAR